MNYSVKYLFLDYLILIFLYAKRWEEYIYKNITFIIKKVKATCILSYHVSINQEE